MVSAIPRNEPKWVCAKVFEPFLLSFLGQEPAFPLASSISV